MTQDASASHPLFARIGREAAAAPVVVAHRGASASFPENTLPAFAAAADLGVSVQEFDVHATRDGVLVCCHDATLDRTTDAAQRLGPGALIAQLRAAEVEQLDAGSWRGPRFAGIRVPTLASTIDAVARCGVPLIEHKGGRASTYVDELRRLDAVGRCILQSFDWDFVAAARQQEPSLAVALLGPNSQHPTLDARVIAAATTLGAGMVHWRFLDLGHECIAAAHRAGLLVMSYTTDREGEWLGGARMGVDAMCTNDPAAMLAARRRGLLART